MSPWYPAAICSKLGNNAGSFTPGPMRGVIHTTEGSSVSGAVAAYKANNSWPHFTVDRDGLVWQHLPINKAARALRNQSGGVETNRQGAIQIEVVGFASKTVWPPAQVLAMNFLMRWIEAQTGILPQAPAFGNSSQYGLRNPLEFTYIEWQNFNGWCGHQHVPENTHWDPGAIDINLLLPEMESPMAIVRVNAPAVSFTITPSGLGYNVLCADGGIFAFGDAPVLAQFGRIEYVLPSDNDWTPDL